MEYFGCPSQPLSLVQSKKVKLLILRLFKLLSVLLDFHNKVHLTCFMIFFYSIKLKTVVTCLPSNADLSFETVCDNYKT